MGLAMLVALFGAAAAAIYWSAQKQRAAALQALSDLLGGGSDGRAHAWGDALGVMVNLRFIGMSPLSDANAVTRVDVDLPAHYPFTLLLRHHSWLDPEQIASGAMIDVSLGDQAFDDTFLVEAAPAAVARKLLTESLRAKLTALPEFQLTTLQGERVLRMELHGLADVAAARSAVAALAAIVHGLREAYTQLEAESQPRLTGAPFRQELDDQPSRDAAMAREAEVEELQRKRRLRQTALQVVAVAVVLGLIVLRVMQRWR